jgi:hypothetical protein
MTTAGNIADLSLAIQAAKGTAAVAAAFRTFLLGGGVGPDRVVNDLEETSGTRVRSRSYPSMVSVSGAPEIAVRPDIIGLILFGALGDITTTEVTPAVEWSHEVVPATTVPWLTAWRQLQQNVFERFTDVKIAQLVLTSEAGQPLKAAVTLEGISPASQTTHTQSAVLVSDGDPFMHYDGAGAFLVEGVAVSEIERIVLTINNTAAKIQGDSLSPFTVAEGMLNISLEITHVITGPELYNRFHYGDETPANNTGPTTEILELTGGVDFSWVMPSGESLQIVAERVQLKTLAGHEPNTSGDPLKSAQTYQVYQPADDGPAIVATLTNAVEEYAA